MTQPEQPAPRLRRETPSSSASRRSGEIRVKLFARTDVGQYPRAQRGQLPRRRPDASAARGLARGEPHASRRRRTVRSSRSATAWAAPPPARSPASSPSTSSTSAWSTASTTPRLAATSSRDASSAPSRPPACASSRRRRLDRTRRGMGTTVTAAALVDDHLFFAQVGDSRGYILRDGTLVQVTRDQSLVNQLIEAGQLTEEEAETFEHNNIILQALGTADTVQVDLTYCELRQGDVLHALLRRPLRHGPLRRHPRGAAHRRPSPSTPASRSPSAPTRPAATTTSPSSSRSSTARGSSPSTPEPAASRSSTASTRCPEEPSERDRTGDFRRTSSGPRPRPRRARCTAPVRARQQGLGSTMVFARSPRCWRGARRCPQAQSAPPAAAVLRGRAHRHPRHARAGVGRRRLVVGVILVLAATAFLFLR